MPALCADPDLPEGEAGALPFPSLKLLSLVANQITVPEDLTALSSWPELVQVYLWENPIAQQRRSVMTEAQRQLQSCGVHVARKPAAERRPAAGLAHSRMYKVDTSMPTFVKLDGPAPGAVSFLEFSSVRTLPQRAQTAPQPQPDEEDHGDGGGGEDDGMEPAAEEVRGGGFFLTEPEDLDAEVVPTARASPSRLLPPIAGASRPADEPAFESVEDLLLPFEAHEPRPHTVKEAADALKDALKRVRAVDAPPTTGNGRRSKQKAASQQPPARPLRAVLADHAAVTS